MLWLLRDIFCYRQRGYQSRAEIDKEEGEEDIEKEEREIVVDNKNHEDEHQEADSSAMEEPNSVMKEVKRGVLFVFSVFFLVRIRFETRD